MSFNDMSDTMRRLIWLLVVFQSIQTGLTLLDNVTDSFPSCGASFFQCNSKNQCIEQEKVCNTFLDCDDYSDEQYCPCNPDDQFQCKSPKQCIPTIWKCDGESDCQDGSDERGCPCPHNQFRCVEDAFCIANQLRCDGTINCNDRSDEANCLVCSGTAVMCQDGMCRHECEKTDTVICKDNQFLCKENNTCISSTRVCNNIADCSDSSDEFDCGCHGDTFRCDNGFCISNEHMCDTHTDCSDNSDETNCACTKDQVRCEDGRCVNRDSLCESDCKSDMRTELCGCRDDEFQCEASKECINRLAVCDGHDNCKDSSDEKNCFVDECHPHYKCSVGNGCYEELQICDGSNDCSDGFDELNCDYTYTCPDGRKLRDYFICDEKIHCEDGSDEKNCTFHCGNGETIIKGQKCDGHYDCAGQSDERNCTCRDGRCPDGLCIGNDAFCDGHFFCEKSKFDERECPCSDKSEFTCANGLCINISSVCDGLNQCGDFSDEGANCNCTEAEFKCTCGMCIPSHRRCDGKPQCPDNSDEEHCECLKNQFTCDDGTCINKIWVCDLAKNCPDGSDESECGCTKDEFKCDDGSCVNLRNKCNGRVDCQYDSSDELNCTCGKGEFRCANGQCIDIRLKCDGTPDCKNSSDEWDCECSKRLDFECGDGECIPINHKCNDRIDCEDGSDESECRCNENEFHCHNARCVAVAFVCDSVDDCGDMSDEANCKCKADEFRCSDRICIGRNKTKAGSADCPDKPPQTSTSTSTSTLTSTSTTDKPPRRPTEEPIVGVTIAPDQKLGIGLSIPLGLSAFLLISLFLLILGKFTPMYKQILMRITGTTVDQHPRTEPRQALSISSPIRDLSYEKHEINRKWLQLGKMLGHGKFGVVHLGNLRLSKANIIQVAVKSIGLTASQAQKEDFLDEIKLLINIGKHQNIISVIGCCISDEPYLLIAELMKYGDLLGFLRICKMQVQNGTYMDDPIYCLRETDMLNIARQVARGMDYLSRTRYYHGDLAARNILVGEKLTVKISDFGLADDIYLRGFKRLAPERKRPIAWVSLETITEDLCTIKSDVWSFGILLYEIITFGSPPYPGIPISGLIQKLKDGYRMSKPEGCTDEVYAVMTRCWQAIPSRRPTFAEIYSTFDIMLQRQTSDCYYVDCNEADNANDQTIKKRRQSDSTT